MSTTRVTPETISTAVSALLKWKQSKSASEKPQLLPQEEFFYLTLTLKHIPQQGCRVNPYKIPLPHALIQDSEICLIVDDRPKSKMTSKEAKKKVQNDGICVSKVLKFSKLKTDYKSFEAKRKLCDSYDMFFSAKGVIPLLPKLLGKTFFKKKKLPLPIDLTHKNWKEQIERACGSGLFYIKSGTCSVVKIGRVSMEEREVVENVVEGINGVVELVPKGWEGVRSFHLKLSGSLSLPLYQAVPDVRMKIEGVREVVEGSESEVEGEGKKERKAGKSKKKKGRIHEVKYMDVSSVGDDEVASDGDEGEKESEKVKDESELVGKKRKKGGSAKGKAKEEKVSEETDDKEDMDIKEVEVKKKKNKADAVGQVTTEKIVEKPAKKTIKKADAIGQVATDKIVEKPAKKTIKKADAVGQVATDKIVEKPAKKTIKKADVVGQVATDKIVEKPAKKTIKKADTLGQVTPDKIVEKPVKKTKKKAGADEEEKIELPVSKEESAEKKGKKKSGLGAAAKTSEKKAKITKKK